MLTGIGFLIPLCMANPNNMIRTDGTRVTTLRQPSWKTEIYGLYVALRTDPLIILLFPMFFASNWFYTYRKLHQLLLRTADCLTFHLPFPEFNDYNAARESTVTASERAR